MATIFLVRRKGLAAVYSIDEFQTESFKSSATDHYRVLIIEDVPPGVHHIGCWFKSPLYGWTTGESAKVCCFCFVFFAPPEISTLFTVIFGRQKSTAKQVIRTTLIRHWIQVWMVGDF